jgi:hypothetical protein
VRRCIHKGVLKKNTLKFCYFKETKCEYAVKIVDISTERQSEREAYRLKEETLSEVKLLKMLCGHPSISWFKF